MARDFRAHTVRIPGRDSAQCLVVCHRLKALPEEIKQIGRWDHFFVQEDDIILHVMMAKRQRIRKIPNYTDDVASCSE